MALTSRNPSRSSRTPKFKGIEEFFFLKKKIQFKKKIIKIDRIRPDYLINPVNPVICCSSDQFDIIR